MLSIPPSPDAAIKVKYSAEEERINDFELVFLFSFLFIFSSFFCFVKETLFATFPYTASHFIAVLRTNFYKSLIPVITALIAVVFVECV
jgi:hypothetical protein